MLRLFTAAMLVNLLTTLPASVDAKGASPMTFSLTSPAFVEGGEIPTRYTCEGQDVSPPLAWSEPPIGTKSLALIVDDPDAPDPKAPKMTWVHWVLYNLPPTAGQLAEAVQRKALPTSTREGLNDWTSSSGPRTSSSYSSVSSANSTVPKPSLRSPPTRVRRTQESVMSAPKAPACRQVHRRIRLQVVARELDRLGLAVPGVAAASHGRQVQGLPDLIQRQEPAKGGGAVVTAANSAPSRVFYGKALSGMVELIGCPSGLGSFGFDVAGGARRPRTERPRGRARSCRRRRSWRRCSGRA